MLVIRAQSGLLCGLSISPAEACDSDTKDACSRIYSGPAASPNTVVSQLEDDIIQET